MSRGLAARLVGERWPELAGASPLRLGEGWDNDVWQVGELVFRFPRRQAGVELIEIEARVLPRLAERLPLPVPSPSHPGAPTGAFPHPWYGHPFLKGTTADRAGLSDAARGRLAPDLGRFLRELHDVTEAEALAMQAPPDTFRGDMERLAARALERAERLGKTRWTAELAAARSRLAEPPSDAVDEPRVLLHGDLYLRHLLVDDTGDLAGVIDWGDVSIGDTAVDLGVVYTFLPREAQPAFWSAYGEVDAGTRRRARHVGACRYGIQLLAYAVDTGQSQLEEAAARGLAGCLDDG